MAISLHDDYTPSRDPLGDSILRAAFDQNANGVRIVGAESVARHGTTEETEISCRDGMRIDLIDRLPPGFAMPARAAVPGQPGPVTAKASQSSGEMRTKRAVHWRHFVIFKKDALLPIRCKTFHD